jgi:regulator of protease activity HflC (stomatin/prohibitin superfamily)
MEKQMRAERDRRATILTAEGVKQSSILTAEGEKQAAILRAEGSRQAKILEAQGEAEATRQVFGAIHEGDPTPDLLTYQYIQNLPLVADGQGMTLMLVPSDAMAALGAVAALGGGFQAGRDAAASTESPKP